MKAFQRLLIAAPAAALLPVALAPMGVLANDLNLDLDAVQEYSISQNASIRDFSDVYPTDWAYQALAELVETYGCVGGYPDGTFRGDQPITRYEMAAVLSACLDSMSAKMDMMEDDMDSMETMEMLKAEFSEELIELKGEVDGLTAKVSALEETQFSTTTKAEFEIATDFVFFSADSEEARGSSTTMVDLEEGDEGYWETEPKDRIPAERSYLVFHENNAPIGASGDPKTGPFLDPNLYPLSGSGFDDYNTANTSRYLLLELDQVEIGDNNESFTTDEDGKYVFLDIDTSTAGLQLRKITNTNNLPTFAAGTDPQKAILIERPVRMTDGDNPQPIMYYSTAETIPDVPTTAPSGTDPSAGWVQVPENGIPQDQREAAAREGATRTLPLADDEILTADFDNDALNDLLVDYESRAEVPGVIGVRSRGTKPVSTPYGEDNSGLALSSSVTIAFTTSFTGEDKLTFKLEGDVMSMENHYLALGNFYDVADNGNTNVGVNGFIYERNFDLGVPLSLTLGTDVDELHPIVGLDTYYGGSGYDGYGVSDYTGGGAAGLGFNAALLDSDAGTVNFSASYSVAGAHATDQTGKKGLFGEDSKRAFALALNWDGALFGGNDARFTIGYQNASDKNIDNVMGHDLTKSMLHLVAGVYFTDAISLSGMYSFGKSDYTMKKDKDLRQWMVALNMDDAFFPGNSAGIAYGTPEYVMDAGEGMNPTKVLELYYSFKVNDNFTVPVYLDFINNAGNYENGNGTSKNAFAFAVRPTLTF